LRSRKCKEEQAWGGRVQEGEEGKEENSNVKGTE
jgi:hypothetical protein